MRGISYITLVGSDFVLQNGSSQILRRLDQDAWTKIRIGIRVSLGHYSAASISGTPRLYLGMCNYNKGGVGSQNSNVHFVGSGQVSTSATYNAGPPATFVLGMATSTRIFNTFSNGTVNSSVVPLYTTTARAMFSVDIDKTLPASTFIRIFRATNSLTANFTVTQAEFFEQMEAPTPALSNYTYTTYGPVAVDEATNGPLDAINLYWDRSQIPLYVYDICWSILA